MNVVDTPDALLLSNTVLCIGNFDGVHLGHQMLLRHMQTLSQGVLPEDARGNRPGVVISFFPTSKMIFGNGRYLTSLEEKVRLFASFEPAAVVVIPFSVEYARTDKQVFLDGLARLTPHTIIVGEDFRFGHKREGTLNDLSHITGKLEVFGMKKEGGDPIKSSRIRALLQEGNVDEANRLLGYAYLATGLVVEGDKRGRTIGFPTANIAMPPNKVLPVGVFAVIAETDAGTFGGMANVGPRPSFPDAPPSLEVHLFDFTGDLYGQRVTVSFKHLLRGQKKFVNLEELKAQLLEDVVKAKAYLEL